MTTDWPLDEQGMVDAPGGRIWYGIVGKARDGVPLLVIHGGPGMSHDYLHPLVDLANERPVIFYDQLDAGKSDRPNDPANWRIERFLEEIDALRNALGLSECALFGNSWGGTLAAAYAAGNPQGLQHVILSSPLIDTAQWIADNTAYREALPEDIRAVMDRCEANGDTDGEDYEAAVNVFYTRHLCRVDPWPAYVVDTFEAMSIDCYQAMWGPNEFTCTGVLRDYDGSGDLASIKVPVLVTCGEFDEATPNSTERFSRMIPGARFYMCPNASHMAFVESRECYNAVLREFLGG